MTISERIFERLSIISMTQKELSEKTGIQQSTISEWKKNKTNPSSDKIMAICAAIGVSPEWLLSGVEPAGSRIDRCDSFTIGKDTEIGKLVDAYTHMDAMDRGRLLGYAEAFSSLGKHDNNKK